MSVTMPFMTENQGSRRKPDRDILTLAKGKGVSGDLSSPPSIGNSLLSAAISTPTLSPSPFGVPPTQLFAGGSLPDPSAFGVPATQLFGGGSSHVSFSPTTSHTGLLNPAASHTESLLSDTAFAVKRVGEFVLPRDLEKVNAIDSSSSTGYLLANMAKGLTIAYSVSNRLLWMEEELEKQRTAFAAERASFVSERITLNSELETLRASHASRVKEIDTLNSQLSHEREEMARWNADLPGIKELAVEDFKDSPDFDKALNQSYIDGFEYFREVAQDQWPDMNFSGLQLGDPDA